MARLCVEFAATGSYVILDAYYTLPVFSKQRVPDAHALKELLSPV
jgi:hypothetical protein